MTAWPDRRVLDLFGIDVPIIQAPMAGPGTADLAIAVSQAGGLGSLPCALLNVERAREALERIRAATSKPINVNFFCHTQPAVDPVRQLNWRARLAPYYVEMGLDPEAPASTVARRPFDDAFCAVVEAYRPEVVSFHFGLPAAPLLERVKATGAKVISSATSVAEALWLEANGCDVVIAMGLEAGGHRGNFLSADITRQAGLFALLPQVADAVKIPVIAAGGIADARGIQAALVLGAAAVQIGTAYLFCPEADVPAPHRQALETASDDDTMVTNLFTGRPARGIVNRLMRELGPIAPEAPAFPLAGADLAPLRAISEAEGRGDFMGLWSGQSAHLAPRGLSAAALTRLLADETLARLAHTI